MYFFNLISFESESIRYQVCQKEEDLVARLCDLDQYAQSKYK